MSSSATEPEPLALDVEVDAERLVVHLSDGRSLLVPLDWFPRLRQGTVGERTQWRLLGGGAAIEWPLLDEHLSVEGLLRGRRSGESERSLGRWIESRRRPRAVRERRTGLVVREYRRRTGSDTWHFCRSCANWPTTGYETAAVEPPTGEVCNECRSQEANGRCG